MLNVTTDHSYLPKQKTQTKIPFTWRLSNAIANSGFTQKALGIRLGVSQALISFWKHGKRLMTPHDVVAVVGATGQDDLLDHYCAECPVAAARERINHSGPKPA